MAPARRLSVYAGVWVYFCDPRARGWGHKGGHQPAAARVLPQAHQARRLQPRRPRRRGGLAQLVGSQDSQVHSHHAEVGRGCRSHPLIRRDYRAVVQPRGIGCSLSPDLGAVHARVPKWSRVTAQPAVQPVSGHPAKDRGRAAYLKALLRPGKQSVQPRCIRRSRRVRRVRLGQQRAGDPYRLRASQRPSSRAAVASLAVRSNALLPGLAAPEEILTRIVLSLPDDK